ncbi:MAG: hypothetical protein WC575_02525 [Patescibacteria group bacterium]
MAKSQDATEREDRFMKLFEMVQPALIPPQNMQTKQLIEKTYDIIQKLQRRLQCVFNISQEKNEQIFLAWYIGELQRLNLEMKKNKYAIYKAFPFCAALSQAIKIYEDAFKVDEYTEEPT